MTKKELSKKTQDSVKFAVRALAFVLLVAFAAYGIRHMLDVLDSGIRDVLTVIFTFLLAYVYSSK